MLIRHFLAFLIFLNALGVVFAQQTIELFQASDFQKISSAPEAVIRDTNQGIDLHVTAQPQNAWDAQLLSPSIPLEINAGDVLLLELKAQIADNSATTEGKLLVYFQDRKTYEALNKEDTNHSIYVSPTSEVYRVYVRSSRNCPAQTVNVSIHCGGLSQRVLISQLKLTYLGNPSEAELPVQKLRYPKTSDDELVLQRAKARIKEVRMSDLQIKVRRANDEPVANAIIELNQVKHAYAFGSFTDAQPLKLDDVNTIRYQEEMKAWFNRVTLPRYFAEWGTDTEEGRQQADKMMRWAASEGFELKTHVLLYPTFLPNRVKALKVTPEQFRQALELAIDDALRRTKDTPMVAWDAINELRDSDLLGEVLGQNYYAELFNKANASQPQSRWFINEYGIIAGHPTQEENIAAYETKIQQILDAGGAIEGIGMQGHFQRQLTPMTRVESILNRFAKFGLPIEITEFDIDTKDEATQAEYTRDFLTLVFSHPSTTGFTTWGFWEGSMWRPRGAMIRRDWTVKPNGMVWKDLIYKDWWTNEKSETNALGDARVRVFHGLHELKVHVNGKTMTRTVEVGSKGKQLVIRVDH